jgi:hypothetical protein
LDLLSGYTFGDVENSSGKVTTVWVSPNGRRGRREPDAVVEHHLHAGPAALLRTLHPPDVGSSHAIKIPTFEQLAECVQTYAGSVTVFDPITPEVGMPQLVRGDVPGRRLPAVVRIIDNAWPGNTVEQWLADYDAGTGERPHATTSIAISSLPPGPETWDFGNKPLSDGMNIGGILARWPRVTSSSLTHGWAALQRRDDDGDRRVRPQRYYRQGGHRPGDGNRGRCGQGGGCRGAGRWRGRPSPAPEKAEEGGEGEKSEKARGGEGHVCGEAEKAEADTATSAEKSSASTAGGSTDAA